MHWYHKKQRLLEKADRAARYARCLKDPESQNTLLSIAQFFEHLAMQVERGAATAEQGRIAPVIEIKETSGR
jgi:hypothetical protein